MTTETGESSLEQKFTRILCVLFKTYNLAFLIVLYNNGQMFGDQNDTQNHLKDTHQDPGPGLGISVKDSNSTPVSYNKTNKLITALYMVTDIMDKDEPIRNKLRTLGTNLISDMHYAPVKALPKISEIMSFLDIAGVVNLISEMNLKILQNEFFELKKAIEEVIPIPKPAYSEQSLSELFRPDFVLPSAHYQDAQKIDPARPGTRIGVQKGSTLLRAIKDMKMSNTRPTEGRQSFGRGRQNGDHGLLKGQRQEAIRLIIKNTQNGATITDIKFKATGELARCGDKTLQRELITMVKNGVLKKTGEKRWSRYFLSN